ncbi:MAG: protein kinase, partial [Myxococcales bacterium]|nr:protein kinase [Myxococcales bacterium]
MFDDVETERSETPVTNAIVVEVDELDGRRLRVVRPRAVPARSPMIARRFDERAGLAVDGVLEYVKGNVSAQPPWFATAQPDGVSLDEWLSAMGTHPDLFHPSLALRIVFDLASLGREIYKASTVLPAVPVVDVVIDRGGRSVVGYLGEFSSRPRLEESSQLANLARLTRLLAGPDLPVELDAAIRGWESGHRLAEICDAIELLWLAHPELQVGHARVAEVVGQILEASPQIAAPTWASVSDQQDPAPMSLDGVSTLKVEPRRPTPDAATPSTLGISRDPQSGATVGGKYRLIRSLGGGAMGQVYEATHLTRGQVCAVKVLRAQGANARAMDEFAERFRREARAMSALDHPNVVAVHDFDSDDVCWLAMDLVAGPSLSTLLASEGPLPVRDAIE